MKLTKGRSIGPRTRSPRLDWVPDREVETTRLMMNLHRAQGLAFAQAREVWARHGLTSAEFDVLATLRNAPPPHELTPSELQASVVITSGGLTKVMYQLEERNLVSRSLHETDQRVKPIRLAPAGKRLVEAAMAELSAASGAWARAVFSAEEIGLLTELLRRLAEASAPAAE
ncbi:MAG: MarR family transcriptional regulator [Rhodocyclaceae bacterium]